MECCEKATNHPQPKPALTQGLFRKTQNVQVFEIEKGRSGAVQLDNLIVLSVGVSPEVGSIPGRLTTSV